MSCFLVILPVMASVAICFLQVVLDSTLVLFMIIPLSKAFCKYVIFIRHLSIEMLECYSIDFIFIFCLNKTIVSLR